MNFDAATRIRLWDARDGEEGAAVTARMIVLRWRIASIRPLVRARGRVGWKIEWWCEKCNR